MIRSFKDEETEKIFHRQRSRRLPANIQQVALRKLRMLNRAITLDDVRIPPANRLEKLRGNRAGQWSIRINDQWRICFIWNDGEAEKVEYELDMASDKLAKRLEREVRIHQSMHQEDRTA